LLSQHEGSDTSASDTFLRFCASASDTRPFTSPWCAGLFLLLIICAFTVHSICQPSENFQYFRSSDNSKLACGAAFLLLWQVLTEGNSFIDFGYQKMYL
jgi:hypothetical protein